MKSHQSWNNLRFSSSDRTKVILWDIFKINFSNAKKMMNLIKLSNILKIHQLLLSQ